MLSLEDINNVQTDEFIEEKVYPPIVPGRVAHIDADFLAYYASYEREGENRTMEDVQLAATTMVTDLRLTCAAERAVLHLTPSQSTKGGRYEAATTKAYQSARVSDKPKLLEALRDWMSNTRNIPHTSGKSWEDAEADDGMAEAAWAAYEEGTSDLCVVASRDKDLRIVPGLHLNFDTGEIEGAEGTFGYIGIHQPLKKDPETGKMKKGTAKPRGYGTKFFWFQMIMGDSADSIPGIPKKGIKAAHDMLKDCESDRECLDVVKAAYKEHGEGPGWNHWETKEPIPWSKAFMGTAQCLWMQRHPGDINDVKKWIKDIINGK